MAIFDLFRSKLTHSDPEIRAEAVRRLDADAVDRLSRIAREDSDVSVRRLAIKKLKDPDILADIGRSETDEALRRFAADKASEIWIGAAVGDDEPTASRALARLHDATALAAVARDAANEAVRRSALARIDDAHALGSVARNAKNPAARIEALRRVSVASILRSVALNDDVEEVALAAVDELEDPEALDAVAQKARRKGARKRAIEKLEALNAALPTSNKQRRAAQRQLVQSVESLATSWDWDKDEARIEEARGQWKELGADAAPELDARFRSAWETFYSRRAKAQQERVTPSSVAAPASAETSAVSAVASPPEAVAAEAAAAPPPAAARASQAEPDRDRRERPAKPRHDDARENEVREKRLKQLTSLGDELERLAKGNNLGEAVGALRRAQSVEKNLGRLPDHANRAEIQARIETGIHALHLRVQELREADEWNRWANEPVREALCARMEALDEEKDLAVAAKKMREIEEEWRKAGPVAKDKSAIFHDRFKLAIAKLRTKTRAYFKERDGERKANLQQKVALCEKAEALRDSTAWKETTEELKKLQAEWKEVGPVPKTQSEALWKRFRAPADAFFERRKDDLEKLDTERNTNLAKKEELCARAEAIAESTEWEVTASELKHLQSDWKKLGPVPRVKADAVWKRFRKACDHFFERYGKRFEIQRDENLERAEGMCAEMERLVATADILDPEIVPTKLAELRATRKAIGPLPEGKAKRLAERFEAATIQIAERFPQHFRGSEYDHANNQKKKETLCRRAEALVERREKLRERGTSVESLAEGLRQALAANAFKGDSKGFSPEAEIATERDQLKADWAKIRAVPGDVGAALEQRFTTALAKLDV